MNAGDWSYNPPPIGSSSRQLNAPGSLSVTTTRFGKGAGGRSSTVFISSGRRSSRTKESNGATRTSASRYEKDCERCLQERERKRETQRAKEREKGGERKLGERFVGTKGRRRDGADSGEGRASRRLLASLLYRVAASTSLTIHVALSPFTAHRGKKTATRFHPSVLHPLFLILLVLIFLVLFVSSVSPKPEICASILPAPDCLASVCVCVCMCVRECSCGARLYAAAHATRACPPRTRVT